MVPDSNQTNKYLHSMSFLRVVALCVVVVVNLGLLRWQFHMPAQHFTVQAQSFLHGRLDIDFPRDIDLVEIDGKYYWPNGPFPTLILMPFQVFLGSGFHQGFAQIFVLGILIFYLYKLARHKKYSYVSSLYFVCAFMFGSLTVGLITQPSSWYFAQIVAMTMLTMALYEWETGRRFILLGVFIGALLSTRPTAATFGLYILFYCFRQMSKEKKGAIQLVQFIIPVLIFFLILGWFNWVRFGNFFDNGYGVNQVAEDSEALRQLGMFSYRHIPMNIYWYFLSSVDRVTDATAHLIFPFIRYNRWGLSFFVVAPFFTYTMLVYWQKVKRLRGLWWTVGITLLVLLAYFTTGWYTFGPRYVGDLLPVLYVLMLNAYLKKELTGFQKNIIVVSSVLNTYLIYATRFV